jgi:hypothetical protein
MDWLEPAFMATRPTLPVSIAAANSGVRGVIFIALRLRKIIPTPPKLDLSAALSTGYRMAFLFAFFMWA